MLRDKITSMLELDIDSADLTNALLSLSESGVVCILDSCGVGHLGSHLLIAGITPTDVREIAGDSADHSLEIFDQSLAEPKLVSFFSISYDLGSELQGTGVESSDPAEPQIFIARFDALIIHDYDTGRTHIAGNEQRAEILQSAAKTEISDRVEKCSARSDISQAEYYTAVEAIREQIRCGDTYQANLTHRITCRLPDATSPQTVFKRLRKRHPAPFAAFFARGNSTVISGSPERFFRLTFGDRRITTSPIKGTRPRGSDPDEDAALRQELLSSGKDRAENTMIVDLLRNDLGRICKFGSVTAEKICDLEEHPSLFHLVSTVSGQLRQHIKPSDILRAMFPCGSITGAPKISTMRIIDSIERGPRGLSMGAIGYCVPDDSFGITAALDLSVAIRTMVVRDHIATFNVGGGIVIDSEPESEYLETLTKASALLDALGAELIPE